MNPYAANPNDAPVPAPKANGGGMARACVTLQVLLLGLILVLVYQIERNRKYREDWERTTQLQIDWVHKRIDHLECVLDRHDREWYTLAESIQQLGKKCEASTPPELCE